MPSKPVMISAGYLPLNYRQPKGFVFRIPFEKLAWSTCLLPLSSFVFCVVWSLLYNFEDSTFTHCKIPDHSLIFSYFYNTSSLKLYHLQRGFARQNVPNFLPSISAAIGNYRTQRFVWGTAIAIHAGPRFLFTSMYRRYYKDVLNKNAQRLATVACILNVVENVALIGLTFIPSAYNYAIHEKCFMTFMLTSELYMVLTCVLLSRYRSQPASNVESKSLRLKYQLLGINLVSFALAGYFFIRHNLYCEPGVMSVLCFSGKRCDYYQR